MFSKSANTDIIFCSHVILILIAKCTFYNAVELRSTSSYLGHPRASGIHCDLSNVYYAIFLHFVQVVMRTHLALLWIYYMCLLMLPD